MINFFPSYDMTFKQKLLALANLIIFISFITSLIFRDISFLLFGLIVVLLLYYVYLYNNQSKKNLKEQLDNKSRAIINDKYCIKPNKDNPFMNTNIFKNDNNIKACNIDNINIKKQIDKFFKDTVYKDVNDIYDRHYSQRQFYTIPSTTIPNDQEAFSLWLYSRKKTCKENNGNQCYNNIM